MSRVLAPASDVAVTLASIEADYAASTEAAQLAQRAHNVALEAHLSAGTLDGMAARVANLDALSQAAGNAYRQQAIDRYRLAQYRIASRRGTREDYLCRRPK